MLALLMHLNFPETNYSLDTVPEPLPACRKDFGVYADSDPLLEAGLTEAIEAKETKTVRSTGTHLSS